MRKPDPLPPSVPAREKSPRPVSAKRLLAHCGWVRTTTTGLERCAAVHYRSGQDAWADEFQRAAERLAELSVHIETGVDELMKAGHLGREACALRETRPSGS